MQSNEKRKLVIVIAIAGVVIVGCIILALFLTKKPTLSTTTTVSTDPITGETIVDVNGKSPEGTAGVVILGGNNLQPMFGDNTAYSVFTDSILKQHFSSNTFVKIAKKDITKKVSINDNGDATITLSFSLYLDNDTSHPYPTVIVIDQPTSEFSATITSPNGEKFTQSSAALKYD